MKPQTPNEDSFPDFKSTTNISSASSHSHTLHELVETQMNDYVNKLGLCGWKVLWVPDPSQPRGKVLTGTKTILLHDEDPEDAMEALVHEILEIKLMPMLRPYRQLVNSLIEHINQQIYQQKEQTINDIVPLLIKYESEERCSRTHDPSAQLQSQRRKRMGRTPSDLIFEIGHSLDEVAMGLYNEENGRINLGLGDARREILELKEAIKEKEVEV